MNKKTYYYNQSGAVIEIKSRWWSGNIADNRRYEHIFGVVNAITNKQKYRESNFIRFARLYHNLELIGLDAGMYARTLQQDSFFKNRVTLNVIKSCIDTVTSKICKSKPRPYFLTEDGDFQLQTKAKYLTQFMDGWMDYAKAYETGRQSFVDACTFGTGVTKVYIDEDTHMVKVERVIPTQLIVDDAEGMYVSPRQMHQVKSAFREVVIGLYPDFSEKILAATACIKGSEAATSSADMIQLIESWHLPSGLDAEDGRHTICIENCTLFDEPYAKDYFPFVFQRWTPSLLGFYGTGLAEELIGIQLEINTILRNIKQAQHLMAVPQVWLEASSQVVTAHIDNTIGGVKWYTGQAPIFMNPTAMSAEVYGYLENLYKKAFEISGISALSATSQKPAGITAAVALETLSDIETERFMTVAQRNEEYYLDLTKIVIDLTRDIYNGDEKTGRKPYRQLSIKAATKDFMEKVSWKDIDLDDDKFVMRVFPTNILPTQPAGRLQMAQQMMQMGIYDREDTISLLDFPDLKPVNSRLTAARDVVLKMVGQMLEKNQYMSPEPYMNLQMAKDLTQSEYLKGKINNVPEERLELLQRFMDDCQAMMDQATQALQPAPQAGTPVAPTAVPQAAPTNDLMPIAGAA